ncbi:hypothetical protein [Pararhodonellum marinum]|uniref:hypothetical protein n=1 Tax=Pararhodonellum marinum TaxID=2755358 RepID=UPI00188E573B|nr:hypothetical protein [Pararhodonellum marinum]
MMIFAFVSSIWFLVAAHRAEIEPDDFDQEAFDKKFEPAPGWKVGQLPEEMDTPPVKKINVTQEVKPESVYVGKPELQAYKRKIS